jgi:hypothetical protein
MPLPAIDFAGPHPYLRRQRGRPAKAAIFHDFDEE